MGGEAGARLEPMLGTPEGATNPTYEQAERFVERSRKPAVLLVDIIREKHREYTGADTSTPSPLPAEAEAVEGGATGTAAGALQLRSGWLTVDGKVAHGGAAPAQLVAGDPPTHSGGGLRAQYHTVRARAVRAGAHGRPHGGCR